jgi:hypothetical protein
MFNVIDCGEWIKGNLWELDLSTAVPNNGQAEFDMAPATGESQRKNAAQLLFQSCLHSEK